MNISNIKGILFDKDGTLLKFEETWTPINRKAAMVAANRNEELANKILVSSGYDPETKKVRVGSILGAGNSKEIAQAWKKSGARLTVPELIEMLDRMFTDAMLDAVPVDNLRSVIQALYRQGYKIGAASSDSEQSIRTFLDSMELSSFFSFVTGYNSGDGHKPEPGMFESFCKHQGLDASQVAMVGDNPQDMEMGRRAKAGLCVAVLSGNGMIEDLNPLADFIITDISELPALLGMST